MSQDTNHELALARVRLVRGTLLTWVNATRGISLSLTVFPPATKMDLSYDSRSVFSQSRSLRREEYERFTLGTFWSLLTDPKIWHTAIYDERDISQIMNARLEASQSHAGRSRGTMIHGEGHLADASLFDHPPSTLLHTRRAIPP